MVVVSALAASSMRTAGAMGRSVTAVDAMMSALATSGQVTLVASRLGGDGVVVGGVRVLELANVVTAAAAALSDVVVVTVEPTLPGVGASMGEASWLLAVRGSL